MGLKIPKAVSYTHLYRIAVKTHKENEKLIAQLKDTMMDKCETLQSVN